MNSSPGSNTKVILTSATGMVGEGVLHECLLCGDISQVLVINRRPCGVFHPKLKEIIHADFFDISALETELVDYNACLFCLGVSSVGMKEPEFYQLTYVLTLYVAKTLVKINPDMVFCYVSGAGTDSTEKGRSMWARVKGKTENDLTKLSFRQVYNFRPGILEPTKGLKNTLSFYRYLGWLLPIVKFLAPKWICSLKELGDAMLNSAIKGYEKQVLEVKDIQVLSKR